MGQAAGWYAKPGGFFSPIFFFRETSQLVLYDHEAEKFGAGKLIHLSPSAEPTLIDEKFTISAIQHFYGASGDALDVGEPIEEYDYASCPPFAKDFALWAKAYGLSRNPDGTISVQVHNEVYLVNLPLKPHLVLLEIRPHLAT